MADVVYSAGLTSKLFWLQESRKTVGYILNGYSKSDIKKIAWQENIYQVKAEYRAYEVLNGTYRRVAALPEAVLQVFITCDVETAKDKVEVYDDILVEYRINSKYPCKRLMEEARKRLAEILDINEPTEFFKTVDKKRDDLLDDAEDTAPVFDFFKGDQRTIFEEAVKNLAYFGNSKTYVSDQELLKVVEEIETIVKDSKPFGKIQRLPELNKRFEELHMGLLEKEAAIMDPLVHDDFLKVKEVLDTKPFAEVLRPRINQKFDEIWEKLRTSSDIAAIKNIKMESDTLKIKCLDEIDEYERAHQPAPEPPVAPVVPGKEPINPTPAPTKVKTKRRKNVSISNVAGARTYSIETEQDIDKSFAEMKEKLLDELEKDTIIILS